VRWALLWSGMRHAHRHRTGTASDARRPLPRLPAGIWISDATAAVFRLEVSRGHEVFAQQCEVCHGEKGEGGVGDRLVGGQGTLSTSRPMRTVGSYWPYAPTLFDYIRRAMPQNAPQSLSNDDVYAVSAYIFNLNGLLPADATLDDKSLPRIKMPNREMFVADPRPDVKNQSCMSNCATPGH
jgi:S-disulfanyl-L-cysteine oxidoreductase SoxD